MSTPDDPAFDFEAIEAIMSERMQWARVQLPFETLGEAVPDLVGGLAGFEPTSTVALVAGLLTDPAYQSAALRIELLVVLVLVHARGSRLATVEDLAQWFEVLGQSAAALGEDPAEDVMVTLVTTPRDHFRMLEGLWESAGFYTQRVLDVLEGMPDTGIYCALKANARALLVVSEIACDRALLTRYQTGSDAIPKVLDLCLLPTAAELRARVTVSVAELSARGVTLGDLRPFILSCDQLGDLAGQEPGISDLDRCPLLATQDGVVLALPTSVTIAVRERLIGLVLGTRQVQRFDAHYANVLGRAIADTTLFNWKSGCRVHWHAARDGQIAGTIMPFDRGHFIVLHFVLPSIGSHEQSGFKHPVEIPETLKKALDLAIASTTRQVEETGDFRGGMHVMVMCGWGQGYVLPVNLPGDPRWRSESMSVADLVRLSNVRSMSVERFWRLVAAQEALEQAGVELLNVNGVLNLFGWMEANDGHLVPHADLDDGKISPDHPLVISPPSNLLRDLRAQADQSTDVHVATDPRGEAHRLQRVERVPFFPGPASARVYACIDCVGERKLVAACEARTVLWLRAATPHLSSSDLQYRLWDMLGKWGGQIVDALDGTSDIAGTFEVTIHLNDVESEVNSVNALSPADPEALLRLEITGARMATIHAARGFLQACRDPRNVAERALVKAMLRAVLTLGGASDPNPLIDRLAANLLPNETARHFHILNADDFTDYVKDSLPTDILGIDEIDSATLRLGLGWSVHEGANEIEGVSACTSLLNTLVDARVAHVVGRLAELSRAALIARLLLNHEAAHAKEVHWKRTSAGVLGLHGDSPHVRATVVEQLSITAGAQVTSRVLVEIAGCATPLSGGRMPDDLEVQSLLAEVALLIRLGNLSDGIYYGVLEPRLRISPLGEILLQDQFGREVVEPMLSSAVGSGYVQAAEGHKRHYVTRDAVDHTSHLFEPEFVAAWKAEIGVDIDDGRRIVDLLESEAITRKRPTLAMRHSELVALLSAVVDFATAERFIAQFRLQPRDRWDTAPAGFKMREILPWRYGRRLSLVARPLLQLDEAEDPSYLFAPRLVRSGFFYVLRGAYDGTLDQEFFTAPEMRDRWWGKANEGHTFNAEVAERLRAAGWNADENIELPAILNAKLDRDYGDVDVLAWRPGHRDVFVIECKDLSLRRNYSEIAALLSDYRGELKNGKPDKLKRHLSRVERLGKDVVALDAHTGVDSTRIVSCMIVAGLVPMQFASIPALADTFVGDIDAFLTQFVVEPPADEIGQGLPAS